MTPERWQQIDSLLQAALAHNSRERTDFLMQVCADDDDLRTEVESLLASHDKAGSFLAEPAIELAAESIAAHAHQLIGQRINHYRIIAPLGAGGMGEVYLAEDTVLGRQVALKLLPTYFSSEPARLRRFEQEARLASTLTHPNICVIHEVGRTEDGQEFIAMEYVEGVTLRRRLDDTTLSIGAILDIASQVATALVKAHAAGIVHRDVKPENIMLTSDGYAKVLDFGIAKSCDQEPSVNPSSKVSGYTTNPGMILGTTAYMSPEQVRAQNIDARSDIWSLGAMLYEMLLGRSPFAGATPSDCIAAILERQPAPIVEHRSDTPAELQWIVSRMLRKDRDERYQTIKEVLGDLRELKQDLDVQSRLTREDSIGNLAHKTNGHSIRTTSGVAIKVNRSAGDLIAARLNRYRWVIAASGVVLLLVVLAAAKYFPVRNQPITSLAVLPFVNVGGEENSEYIADGVTEDLIDNLSHLPNMKVIARNSVFRYKVSDPRSGVPDPQKAAHELGVQAVLIGRVIQHGEDLFVSAELVSADDNSHIWGVQYNRKLSAVFAVQEQIAGDISRDLRARLGSAIPEPPSREPANRKAFEYYMQGQSYVHRRTREDLTMAGSYYQKAIEADQNYALAYAGLAEVYQNLGVRGYIPPIEGRRKSEEAARKALALDDNLAEAHVMMGNYYVGCAPYQFAEGDREITRAIELKPSLAIAHLYLALSFLRQNRLDEGLNEMLKARELDPFSAIIARQVSLYYLLKRDYSRALQLLKQASEMGPPFTASNEIGIYVQNKLYDEALAVLDQQDRERKEDPILIYSRGMVYAAQGRRADALKIAKELERLSSNSSEALWIAKIYSGLNEKDQAFSWLERGLATGALGTFFSSDPTWDNLRSDPRFADTTRKMGIQPAVVDAGQSR
jgi:eukaryotic-like serine/threonine-protein kinase